MPQANLDLAQLKRLARETWSTLPHGAVVWLSGDLGSGKTTFVRALTEAARGELAHSPTYAMVHRYTTPEGHVYHIDCYRVRSPEEALDLGLDDLADARLVLIEWPERAGEFAPPPDAHFRFSHVDSPGHRDVERLA